MAKFSTHPAALNRISASHPADTIRMSATPSPARLAVYAVMLLHPSGQEIRILTMQHRLRFPQTLLQFLPHCSEGIFSHLTSPPGCTSSSATFVLFWKSCIVPRIRRYNKDRLIFFVPLARAACTISWMTNMLM